MPEGKLDFLVSGGNKYRDLTLQVGGVSKIDNKLCF
jgi:hypothetical protein